MNWEGSRHNMQYIYIEPTPGFTERAFRLSADGTITLSLPGNFVFASSSAFQEWLQSEPSKPEALRHLFHLGMQKILELRQVVIQRGIYK